MEGKQLLSEAAGPPPGQDFLAERLSKTFPPPRSVPHQQDDGAAMPAARGVSQEGEVSPGEVAGRSLFPKSARRLKKDSDRDSEILQVRYWSH